MTAAIITAIVVGGGLGVLAAESDRLSSVIRPINDFMQTIPPFVLLLPLVTFFQVGDFSSYLAISSFAIKGDTDWDGSQQKMSRSPRCSTDSDTVESSIGARQLRIGEF